MRGWKAIGLGLLLIAAAFVLAAGMHEPENVSRPINAIALATQFHTTPSATPTSTATQTATATPTPTLTPAPTVTRVFGWVKLHNRQVEIWLPVNYSGGGFDSTIVLYAYDAHSPVARALTSVYVVRAPRVAGTEAARGLLQRADPDLTLTEGPQEISLGRYEAWVALADGYEFGGVRIRRLLYVIPHGDESWLVIFVAGGDLFEGERAWFEQSIASFSILQ